MPAALYCNRLQLCLCIVFVLYLYCIVFCIVSYLYCIVLEDAQIQTSPLTCSHCLSYSGLARLLNMGSCFLSRSYLPDCTVARNPTRWVNQVSDLVHSTGWVSFRGVILQKLLVGLKGFIGSLPQLGKLRGDNPKLDRSKFRSKWVELWPYLGMFADLH